MGVRDFEEGFGNEASFTENAKDSGLIKTLSDPDSRIDSEINCHMQLGACYVTRKFRI